MVDFLNLLHFVSSTGILVLRFRRKLNGEHNSGAVSHCLPPSEDIDLQPDPSNQDADGSVQCGERHPVREAHVCFGSVQTETRSHVTSTTVTVRSR